MNQRDFQARASSSLLSYCASVSGSVWWLRVLRKTTFISVIRPSQSANKGVITMDIDDILRNRYRDTRLCSECVEEPDLQNYIASADGAHGCSFCDHDDAPTCEFLDFMEHVRECTEAEYDLAANFLSWESGEGGWQWGPVWNTSDLILHELQIGLVRAGSDELLEAMADCLGDHDWCVRNPYGENPLEALRVRWQQFCHLIKHRTRFFLDRWAPPISDGSLGVLHPPTPAEMLSAIGDRVLRLNLIRDFPADLTIYRARYCKDDQLLRTPEELGPPSPGTFSVGKFAVRRSLRLLDLTNLPEVPNFFASIQDSQPWGRLDAQFFSELVKDLTRPIARDDRVHIEYISTQVVIEYCRMAFHDEHHTAPLDGIVYPSARNCGRPSVVLFADRAAVVGIEPERPESPDVPWLELIDVEHFEATESLRFTPLELRFE